MVRPIIVDLPYPSLEGIEKDFASAKIIASAYAGLHSELSAILQYVYHHYFFDECGNSETADTLIGISIAEMRHLEVLGALLLKLGMDPIFTRNPPYRFDYYNTSCISYSKTTHKMLLDDISGEMVAIKGYEQMLDCLKNERVQAVISRIILDEELHVKALKEQLNKFC